MNNFGKKIKELREEKGISQFELSQKIGYSKTIIYYWEKEEREPTLTAIITLCDYFNVSADYLLGRKDYDDYTNEKQIKGNNNVSNSFNNNSFNGNNTINSNNSFTKK